MLTMDKWPIFLTDEELEGITGYIRSNAQITWLRSQGFTVLKRADGRPLVSRSHFEEVMKGIMFETHPDHPEPDYEALF